MAGDIEEPFSFSFQTDSLHSGSISFGRFENEPLSWERRSSFSHNRYLEEVEKCSKPGSVIEKKAYFEAHFKRKALLRLQLSSECQNGTECQSSENDVLENEGYRDEFDNVIEGTHCDQFDDYSLENPDYEEEEFCNGNEESHYIHFEKNTLENGNYVEEFDSGNDGSQFDHVNENNQFSNFDESREGSEYHGDFGVLECEREESSILPAESHKGAALDNADVFVNSVSKDVNIEQIHQSEIGGDKSLPSNDEFEIDLHEKHDDYTVDGDESSKSVDLSPRTGRDDKSSSEHRQSLSSKFRAPVESKSTKPKLNSLVNIGHVKKHISHEASKTAGAKNQNRKEKESTGKTKAEKLSLQTVIPVRHISQRSPKTEDSESSAAKSMIENKSEKQLRAKKVVESQPSASKKIDPRARQTTNRLKQSVDSTKSAITPSASGFSFRSDERAARRKEYFTKLEEKMQAKEAEKSQIQAKTQEKTEAELKQFRKSLKFKATPMPSFYHVATAPGSDGNKVLSCDSKAAKIRNKSTSLGIKGTARSPLLSKAGKERGLSANASANTVHKPESSGASKWTVTISSTPPTPKSSCHEVITKNGATEKKEREKESGKITKDQRSEGKPKMGARRNSNEIIRKNMKGIGIGSSSGMGHLAVGVAS